MNIRNQYKKFAILTHDDFDGYACGALMRAYLRDNALAESIETFYVQYGSGLPEKLVDIPEKNIIILDFSYDYETTKDLFEKSAGFFMLDHHVIDPRINDILGTHICVDGSAVGHLHEYLYGPSTEMNRLTVYAHDYDSWTHNHPESKFINHVLLSNKKGRDEVLMDELYKHPDTLHNMAKLGEIFINAIHERYEYVFKDKKNYNTFNINGIETLWFNSTDWINRSIVAETAMKMLDVKTVVVYSIFHDKILFSVRSNEGGLNAGEFAKLYGGGGRVHTAAFSMSVKDGLYLIAYVNGLKL